MPGPGEMAPNAEVVVLSLALSVRECWPWYQDTRSSAPGWPGLECDITREQLPFFWISLSLCHKEMLPLSVHHKLLNLIIIAVVIVTMFTILLLVLVLLMITPYSVGLCCRAKIKSCKPSL